VRRTTLYLIESDETGKDWWEKPRNMREKLVLQMVMRDPMAPMEGEKVKPKFKLVKQSVERC